MDELYLVLAGNGIEEYQKAIEAEYCGAGQTIEHRRFGDGLLSVVRIASRGHPSTYLTHLIYGYCTAAQIRDDLIRHGLGSLPIIMVYP